MKTLVITDSILDIDIRLGYYHSINISNYLKDIKFIRIDSINTISKRTSAIKAIKLDIDKLNNLSNDYDNILISIFIEDMREGFFNSFSNEYKEKYTNIVSILSVKTKNLIIVMPYKPFIGKNSPYLYYKDEINNCYNEFNDYLLSIITTFNNICLLDLYNSIDSNDSSNFLSKSEMYLNKNYSIKIINIIKKINNKTINITSKNIYHIK